MAILCPSKKEKLALENGEYFEKDNIYGVNFDSGICVSMEYIHVKEYMMLQPRFILQISIFV